MKPTSFVHAIHVPRPSGAVGQWFLLCVPCMLVVASVRQTVESSMALQMLVEYPLLMASGFAATALIARRREGSRAIEVLMRMGLVPLLFVSLCLMFWMVPLALDLARLNVEINAAKYGSLLIAGAALRLGLPRAPAAVLVFFAGNLVWTLATVGMLFHDASSRLCASFLLPDQQLAGIGLVACAIEIGFALILHLRRLPGYGFGMSE